MSSLSKEAPSSTDKLAKSNSRDELDCPICYFPFTKSTVIMSCSHKFCKDRFQKWTKTSRTCPICRGLILYVVTDRVKGESTGFGKMAHEYELGVAVDELMASLAMNRGTERRIERQILAQQVDAVDLGSRRMRERVEQRQTATRVLWESMMVRANERVAEMACEGHVETEELEGARNDLEAGGSEAARSERAE
jgi:hypothetical protein